MQCSRPCLGSLSGSERSDSVALALQQQLDGILDAVGCIQVMHRYARKMDGFVEDRPDFSGVTPSQLLRCLRCEPDVH